MPENKFPTEIVDIPSKGYFYPEKSPLSSGKVELKYMTAKDEDILTSQNLIAKGVVLDVLLNNIIVTPGIKVSDLLIGDKNALLIAARVLAYGKEYEFEVSSPVTGESTTHTLDLTVLKDVELDFSKFTKGLNEFDFTLPTTDRVIKYKLLTSGDIDSIERHAKSLSKLSNINKTLTTRLKSMILEVDGNDEKQYISNFVDNEFFAVDSLSFREHLSNSTPDIDLEISIEVDGEEVEITVPMTVAFFWPSS
ncbi:MAG TPA: hypothetical protein EYG07_05590 [Alphaproteobacteria bacterium]|jgi:hypothetical protein|nr:hypothetical protein [Alphaproteobacteria bacterium]